MIELENAYKAFDAYLEGYDVNQLGISLKIEHTFNVVMYSNEIALSLNLSQEDIKLAK